MGLKRTGRIKPKKRTASEFRRVYGSKGFQTFIRTMPCWACGYAGPSPRVLAHTENGGMGRKADAKTCIALCNVCHHKQHQSGWVSIAMTAESRTRAAEQTWAAWEAKRGDSEEADEGAEFSADAEGTEDADPDP
jgi:hypothetical protein